jgi:hypothetical protein
MTEELDIKSLNNEEAVERILHSLDGLSRLGAPPDQFAAVLLRGDKGRHAAIRKGLSEATAPTLWRITWDDLPSINPLNYAIIFKPRRHPGS